MRTLAAVGWIRQGGSWLRRPSAWLAVAVSVLTIGVGAWLVHSLRGDSASSAVSGVKVGTKGMAAATPAPETSSSRAASEPTLATVPFHAVLDGTVAETGPDSSGRITIDLSMRTTGVNPAELLVVLVGRPADGGVALASSSVEFGPISDPRRYRGEVMALDEEQFVSKVSSGGANSLDLDVILHIDPASRSVRGTLDATSANRDRSAEEKGGG